MFARFDSSFEDEEYGFVTDSGRCVYVTDTLEDANRVWDVWSNGGFHPEQCNFSVRRGGVQEHSSVHDKFFKELLWAADDHSWSDSVKELLE